ncbi:MAG: ATP-binding protein, partial [Proteobacteria bacterium]|nr:ATP-binding protein [Pseudomonadota bacterium]
MTSTRPPTSDPWSSVSITPSASAPWPCSPEKSDRENPPPSGMPPQNSTPRNTASSGSILEFYRLLLAELGIQSTSHSRAFFVRAIRHEILDLALAKKIKPVLIVDEASLMRLDVFAELHNLTQFEGDSKPYLPMVLAGQNNLIDRLR